MHISCLIHALSDQDRRTFETDGYLLVPNALSAYEVTRLTALVDRLGEERAGEVEPNGRLHLRDFLHRDPMFMDLLDWPTTFPKVWGILGWHIQLYLSHVDITPPVAEGTPRPKRLGWHQDSGRVNREIESDPRPPAFRESRLLPDRCQRTRAGQFLRRPGQPPVEPVGARRPRPGERHPGLCGSRDRRLVRPAAMAFAESEHVGRYAQGRVLRIQLPVAAPAGQSEHRGLPGLPGPDSPTVARCEWRRPTATPRRSRKMCRYGNG